MPDTDVAIVGAGPAGLAAAEVLSSHGLAVTVIDEQMRAGGQIMRQPPARFQVTDWLDDNIYDGLKALLGRATNAEHVHWRFGTCVVGMEQLAETGENGARYRLLLDAVEATELLTARAVIAATGCYDMPVCFPGWNLPGCMAAGGIQAFLKGQQIVPGSRFVFAGTHPLQLIVADQVLRAGGTVEEIVFAQSRREIVGMLANAGALIPHWKKLAYIARVLRRLVTARVPLRFGHTVLRAKGQASLDQVELAPLDPRGLPDRSRIRTVDCDCLGVCYGFLASSELLRQAGAKSTWSPSGGGWVITVDAGMRTSRPGLYGAGEITGIAGAEAAQAAGAIAAHSLLSDLAIAKRPGTAKREEHLRRGFASEQRFAAFLTRATAPADTLLNDLLTGDTIVCKCQEITRSQIEDTLSAHPYMDDASALKLVSRTGMGLCQGRYCNYYVNRLLALARPASPYTVQSFSAQIPVKPVLIHSLVAARPPRRSDP